MKFRDISNDDILYLVSRLDEKYSDVEDVFSLTLSKLRDMIVSMEFFDSDIEYCNQNKLEAIMVAWNDFRHN
ncbi:Fe-S assembly protein IscX [Anaplasmataceae bacterium AB001_6]|nr:Fe-S assembly protein IscX [Anaplasmataceae bacterium AB001_6]